mgnify:CR=1 FL=1
MIQEVFYDLNVLLHMITHFHQIFIVILQQLHLFVVSCSHYLLEVYIFKIKMVFENIFHVLLCYIYEINCIIVFILENSLMIVLQR